MARPRGFEPYPVAIAELVTPMSLGFP